MILHDYYYSYTVPRYLHGTPRYLIPWYYHGVCLNIAIVPCAKKHVLNNNVFNTCFLDCPELGVNMVVQ